MSEYVYNVLEIKPSANLAVDRLLSNVIPEDEHTKFHLKLFSQFSLFMRGKAKTNASGMITNNIKGIYGVSKVVITYKFVTMCGKEAFIIEDLVFS
ncbi:MAG: hypothetical protein GQ570_04185 [Helicobacteraceae bacterium]|nr:hypothetical protein [Helicobacteraceae bacterium]